MSKCPKCGADAFYVGPIGQDYRCGTCFMDGACCYIGRKCLEHQLAAMTVDREQYREWWETSCAHVKEALEFLGVDVGVDGYIADTWTLRLECKLAGDKLRKLEAAQAEK